MSGSDILSEDEQRDVQLTVASIRDLEKSHPEDVSSLQRMLTKVWGHVESLGRRNLALANQRLNVENAVERAMARAWDEGYEGGQGDAHGVLVENPYRKKEN